MHIKDRVEFTKSIECNISLEEIIKNYFDEIMTIYDLVGIYDNFKIEGNFEDANIYFNIVFKSPNDAIILKKIIDDIRVFSKYNRYFTCTAQHIDNTLCINIY